MCWRVAWVVVLVLGLCGLGDQVLRAEDAKIGGGSTAPAVAAPPSQTASADGGWLGRGRGLVGIAVILGLAYVLSENRRAISLRVVFWGLALQWILAIMVLRVPAG